MLSSAGSLQTLDAQELDLDMLLEFRAGYHAFLDHKPLLDEQRTRLEILLRRFAEEIGVLQQGGSAEPLAGPG